MTQNPTHATLALLCAEPTLHTIATRIAAAGGTPVLVGGSVRDALLGTPSKDWDILVAGVDYAGLQALFAECPQTIAGEHFAALKVVVDGHEIDFVAPRAEVSTGRGHRDFTVEVLRGDDHAALIRADLERRDFTVNALGLHLTTGELIDHHGGAADLASRTLRAVGDAGARLGEDPLRILRAVRFHAKLDLVPDAALQRALRAHAHTLAHLPAERVWSELSRTLEAPNYAGALRLASELGVLDVIIPEWATTDVDQRNPHHDQTVREHLLTVCELAAGGDLVARLAALLHDIGKPGTMTVDDRGCGHFYGHDAAGAELCVTILTRLKAPSTVVTSVSTLVREHMRLTTDAGRPALRRLANRLDGELERFVHVFRADRTAHVGADPAGIEARVEALRTAATELPHTGFDDRDLALDGHTIRDVLGLSGRAIGQLKDTLCALVVDGTLDNDRDALLARARTLV